MELRVPTFYEVNTILEKDKRIGECTDLAVLTGAILRYYYPDKDDYLKKPSSFPYFMYSSYFLDKKQVLAYNNTVLNVEDLTRSSTIRPILCFEKAEFQRFFIEHLEDSPETVLYGSYPQTVAPISSQELLESLYQKESLEKTKRTYTFDGCQVNDYLSFYKPIFYPEYKYGDSSYIRVHANMDEFGSYLSDGTYYKNGSNVWVKVEPVSWIVDYEHNKLLSRKCLVSGLAWVNRTPYLEGSIHDGAGDLFVVSDACVSKYVSDVLFYDLGLTSPCHFANKDLTSDMTYVMERLRQLRFSHPEIVGEVDSILERVVSIDSQVNGAKALKKVKK